MRLALCQFDIQLGEIEKNLSRITEYLLQAKRQDADLVAFPESSLGGYCFTSKEETEAYSMEDGHPVLSNLQSLAIKENILLVLGYIEKHRGKLYNTSGLFGLSEGIKKYRKAHTLILGLDRFIEEGDLGFPVFETPHGKIGLNICYDQRFPEAARMSMLNGAQLIIASSNIPEAAAPIHNLLTRARAFENRVFYAMVNRTGHERGTNFIGQSVIVDPLGKELVKATKSDDMLILAELDLSLADQKKSVFIKGQHEVDLIGDRRPDLYTI